MRNVLISGRPCGGGGGVTPGAYTGMARDLSTLSVHFKPWMVGWIAFTLSWQDPRGKTRGICSAAAILQMELETSAVPVCERTGYVGEHVFWQKTVHDCYISLVFCSF